MAANVGPRQTSTELASMPCIWPRARTSKRRAFLVTTIVRRYSRRSCSLSEAIVRSRRGIARHDSYLPGLSLCKPVDETGRSSVADTRSCRICTGASASVLAPSPTTERADKSQPTPELPRKDRRASPSPRSSPKERHHSRTRR